MNKTASLIPNESSTTVTLNCRSVPVLVYDSGLNLTEFLTLDCDQGLLTSIIKREVNSSLLHDQWEVLLCLAPYAKEKNMSEWIALLPQDYRKIVSKEACVFVWNHRYEEHWPHPSFISTEDWRVTKRMAGRLGIWHAMRTRANHLGIFSLQEYRELINKCSYFTYKLDENGTFLLDKKVDRKEEEKQNLIARNDEYEKLTELASSEYGVSGCFWYGHIPIPQSLRWYIEERSDNSALHSHLLEYCYRITSTIHVAIYEVELSRWSHFRDDEVMNNWVPSGAWVSDTFVDRLRSLIEYPCGVSTQNSTFFIEYYKKYKEDIESYIFNRAMEGSMKWTRSSTQEKCIIS